MDILTKKLSKYSKLKAHASLINTHIRAVYNEIPTLMPDGKRNISAVQQLAKKASVNLSQCANYLVFNDYYTIDKLKLVKARTCKMHLLCPFCAARRASKQVEKNGTRIKKIMAENPHLIPVMITLTVKNGENLEERYEHLKKSFQALQMKRKDAHRGKSKSEFSKVAGSMFSYEVTNKGNGWHPHVHMIALLDSYIDQKELSREWKKITKDSSVVDIRKIKNKSPDSISIDDALLEVFKYAVKFHDLEPEQTWQAYLALKGKNLLGCFGNLYGVIVEPETLLDEVLEDLPYIERFNVYSKKAGEYVEKTSIKREPDSITGRHDRNKPHTSIRSLKGEGTLKRPDNLPSKAVLIPLPQIRNLKSTSTRIDQYFEENFI